ncbi:MAG: tetraacyldisaccharide 4'-kinase, partial [Verrucomicrobia bacterium 21-51-4]
MRTRFEDRWERFVLTLSDIIYDRVEPGSYRCVRAVLWAFSCLYGVVIKLRNWLYEKRMFHDHPLGCLVVVVGNLTVGGTGKTPIVEMLSRSLQARGRKVAILSRGYKSRPERWHKRAWRWLTHTDPEPPKIVSDGQQVLLDSARAGDEPFMLAQNLPGVVVLVDKNRVKAGQYAIEKFGADTLILDDGFQYRPLRGRLNLVLIDQTNPFGNRYMLPRGILREPIRALRRASYVFLTKSFGPPSPELEASIRHYFPEGEVIQCAHKPCYLQELGSELRLPLDALQGLRIAALSGIAVPENFEHMLQELGAQLVQTARFLDHHRFSEQELVETLEAARELGVQAIIMTEKDAVRIPKDFDNQGLKLYYLRLQVQIVAGDAEFETVISRLCLP